MANKFNTAFQIHEEIYNTRTQIEKKKDEYNKLIDNNENFNRNLDMVDNRIDEINISINSLNNFLTYNSDNSNCFATLLIKNEYCIKLETLNDEKLYYQHNIYKIENELTRFNIEFIAYDSYIDNLYKMIPRINRWSNIKNMTPHELYIETCRNNIQFEMQLSILKFPPPQLERN